jgi:menaquinone-dependent protoporphyrinogen oxidase
MGKIQKELTEFINCHLNALLQKRIALFICAAEHGETLQTELQTAFPKALYDHAVAKEAFGYELNFEKMNLIEKLALRFVKKVTESSSQLSEETITKFAGAVNQE